MDVDYSIESFYKYFAIFLLFAVVFLGGYYLILKANPQILSQEPQIAVLETNRGDIRILLYTEDSPVTANNFKGLVKQGFYNKVKFHRVIDGFIIQSGDPNTRGNSDHNTWGIGGPGYTIEDEYIEGLSNTAGTVAMANSGPNTGGSQFFINVVDNPDLDWDKAPFESKHPVFGEVIEGMDVVVNISKAVTSIDGFNRPLQDIVIVKAYMEKTN